MNTREACTRCAAICFERNPLIARMLGLCPLLAIVDGPADALRYGGFFVAAVALTAIAACITRDFVGRAIRPLYLQVLAAVCVAGLGAAALAGWHGAMAGYGVYLPLVAANCLLLEYAQERAQQIDLRGLLRDLPVTAAAVWSGVIVYGTLRGWLAAGIDAAGPADGLLPLAGAPAGALILLGLIAAAAAALRRPPRDAGAGDRDGEVRR